MEQINKLLIFLVGLAIGAIIYIVICFTENVENKNVIIAPHPYNECIKLLIDQVNKESKTSDFDKMKAVCFGLLEKEKN